MEQTTVTQPLELANGKEYEHRVWGRVMFIAVHPHDGATKIVEREHPADIGDTMYDTCESSDLTPCNDGESYWPFLGHNCKERQRQAQEYNEKQNAHWDADRALVEKLKAEAISYGVSIVYHGGKGDHFTLVGKVVVEYWPLSKARTAHVRGEEKGRKDVTPEQACRLAQQIPDGE